MIAILSGCDGKENKVIGNTHVSATQFNGYSNSKIIQFNGKLNNNISDFNGDYICEISQSMNQLAIYNGHKNVFPSVVTHAKLTIKDGVMTIHGMKYGNYISHKMTLSDPYIDETGRVYKSEIQLEYKDRYTREDFSKKYGIAMISQIYLIDKRFMQQFTNCK